ncbi:MAG TPA: radical SAM protein [Acidobacteriaceae bacterium]|nr:radical SAM protein [Acidobacteriaceae bacterium]
MKLGLIAMSGVRAHNDELTALGLTLPGFVERNRVIASLPSLGLLTLAGLTPRDVDLRYLEVPELAQVGGVPEEFDAVAISSFSAQINEAYELADRYRALGTRVVLGGLHVSALPDEALQHADAVVVGEGEPVWPVVIRDLKSARLQPVYDARGAGYTFAASPMPRFDLLDIERYNRLTVQTQRGCPFRCEFCAASIRISPSYKIKPVERVIAEIRAIKSLWSRPFIEFADDNSFANKSHSKQLLRDLAKEDIRWFTETDLSVADDLELLNMLRDAGCAEILIGFEATTFSSVDGLEQRSNWKAKRVDSYLEAIRRIQDRGVRVNGCFILGLDSGGPDSFDAVWNFVQQSGLYDVQVTVQTAFPGTPLYARLKNEGRILRDEAWELCTLFDVNFCPARMSVAELESGFRHLVGQIYSDECTRARRAEFHRNFRKRLRSQAALPREKRSAAADTLFPRMQSAAGGD